MDKQQTLRAIRALIEVARLNFPSSSDLVRMSVEGRNSASILVEWNVLLECLREDE